MCSCFQGLAPKSHPAPLLDRGAADRGAVTPADAKTEGQVGPPIGSGTLTTGRFGAGAVGSKGVLGVGIRVEVYSHSCDALCPGLIEGVDNDQVLVAYQKPDEKGEAQIYTKALPISSNEFRLSLDTGILTFGAAVEVFSHSYNAWCAGRVRQVKDGVATIFFLYPDMPEDTDPVIKHMPVGHADIRSPGKRDSTEADGFGDDTLAVGRPVHVFSNSLAVWCPGRVQAVTDDRVVVAFHYPDMDPTSEPAIKDLPRGHLFLRMLKPERATRAVTAADLCIGASIEVFSHSRQFWCPGHVKEMQDGMVMAVVRYPDVPPDAAPFEKAVPVGHPDLRLGVVQ